MKLAVIGASRGIGRAVVDYALSREHEVNGVARTATKLEGMPDAFHPFDGDATNPIDLAQAIDGCDAVIMTLGVPRNIKVLSPTTLFSSATQALLSAMSAADISRLLVVTGFGAGESYSKLSSLEKAGLTVFLGRAYADKALQEELIKGSDLDWTIARPGILNDNAMSKKYHVLVEPDTWRQGIVSRADVAHFLVTAAEDGSYIHQTPAIQR